MLVDCKNPSCFFSGLATFIFYSELQGKFNYQVFPCMVNHFVACIENKEPEVGLLVVFKTRQFKWHVVVWRDNHLREERGWPKTLFNTCLIRQNRTLFALSVLLDKLDIGVGEMKWNEMGKMKNEIHRKKRKVSGLPKKFIPVPSLFQPKPIQKMLVVCFTSIESMETHKMCSVCQFWLYLPFPCNLRWDGNVGLGPNLTEPREQSQSYF